MIKKILVANRGEIAVRVMRSCREMGIRSIAVYSDADRASQHVRYADQAYHIGPAPSIESYLSIEKIIDAAKKSGADAIHPGYGFLSENAAFSRRCREEGIIFIGPSPEVIQSMGDKISARKMMMAAGVPVVPGTEDRVSSPEEALAIAREIGYPVMVKASAGGGGKGMRLVMSENELVDALRSAKSEAKASFGDGSVYIEKFIQGPHHIEFQVMGDSHGNVIHLCERECSIQRRHQKIVEETPSPLMTPELRDKMGMAAVAAAKAVNYQGAGTIEFLVGADRNYYFLEMNTRLQVEHPITEKVIGIDLVQEQIRVAMGLELSLRQEEVFQFGHAIECRIYAEDPQNNFMPCPGKIKHITEPLGFGVRTDGYIYEGYEIPIYYDPMISKLIVWGRTREESVRRMKRALFEYKITGVKTSIPFLEKIMDTPDFLHGDYDTGFIEKNQKHLLAPQDCDNCEDLAIMTAFIDYLDKVENAQPNEPIVGKNTRWKEFGRLASIRRLT